jgi:hypothetical protein
MEHRRVTPKGSARLSAAIAVYICLLLLLALLPNGEIAGLVASVRSLFHLPGHGATLGEVPFPGHLAAASGKGLLRKAGDVLQYGLLWLLLVVRLRGPRRGPAAFGATMAVSAVNETEHLWAPGRVFEPGDVLLVGALLLPFTLAIMLWPRVGGGASKLAGRGEG